MANSDEEKEQSFVLGILSKAALIAAFSLNVFMLTLKLYLSHTHIQFTAKLLLSHIQS